MDRQEYLLSLNNISKSFVGVQALDQVTFNVVKGKGHALIGENGAGKSTLIKILAGAHQLDSGQIILSGEEVHITSPHNAREMGMGIIYQELSLINQLNAVENLFLGQLWKTKRGTVNWRGMKERALEIFADMGLDIDISVPVNKLSIGQCQLIEISRALINKSKVIIMDEPTSSLTDTETEHLFSLIRRLKEKEISVIYISHKLEELFQVCDYVSVLKDGKNAGEFVMSETNKEELVHAMVGRELKDYYPEHDYKRGELLMQVKNLNCGQLVKDVSFDVYAGEVLGFSGLIGAGRSETMHALFGSYGKEARGEVFVKGKKRNIKSPKQAIENGIALAPEDRKHQGLVLRHSIKENISLANFNTVTGVMNTLNRKKEHDIAEKYKGDLKIATPDVEKMAGELSGGNQQKVVIGKWLNTHADIYIMDEPTRGVDVGAKAEIYRLIRMLAKEGKAVIIVSSELPEILGVSDRVIVMHNGRIKCELEAGEVNEGKIMTYAIGGDENDG